MYTCRLYNEVEVSVAFIILRAIGLSFDKAIETDTKLFNLMLQQGRNRHLYSGQTKVRVHWWLVHNVQSPEALIFI